MKDDIILRVALGGAIALIVFFGAFWSTITGEDAMIPADSSTGWPASLLADESDFFASLPNESTIQKVVRHSSKPDQYNYAVYYTILFSDLDKISRREIESVDSDSITLVTGLYNLDHNLEDKLPNPKKDDYLNKKLLIIYLFALCIIVVILRPLFLWILNNERHAPPIGVFCWLVFALLLAGIDIRLTLVYLITTLLIAKISFRKMIVFSQKYWYIALALRCLIVFCFIFLLIPCFSEHLGVYHKSYIKTPVLKEEQATIVKETFSLMNYQKQ